MSVLTLFKPRPAQYIEDGQDTALRIGKTFIFDSNIPALASAASGLVRFTTGNSAIVFTGGEIIMNQEAVEFIVYEDTTYTDGGVLTTAYIRNMNRMINKSSEISTYDAPTVDVIGDVVAQQNAVGQSGKNVNQPGFGGGVQDANFILKPNTEHLFTVTNNSVLAVDVEAHYFFREVEARQYNQ